MSPARQLLIKWLLALPVAGRSFWGYGAGLISSAFALNLTPNAPNRPKLSSRTESWFRGGVCVGGSLATFFIDIIEYQDNYNSICS